MLVLDMHVSLLYVARWYRGEETSCPLWFSLIVHWHQSWVQIMLETGPHHGSGHAAQLGLMEGLLNLLVRSASGSYWLWPFHPVFYAKCSPELLPITNRRLGHSGQEGVEGWRSFQTSDHHFISEFRPVLGCKKRRSLVISFKIQMRLFK